ncbi:hypothetical protein NEOLEDRAFT_1144643 [Neolentinus lepideus HHB14362 ss-1]|uniref:Uncharacterized protein n=1 Tax=Neolentinus lepideus HHB14362 ss-1 TaxID=1314782 RepID=A0A165VUD3_9AGAM|nr:hypothetical protein NEOLEDRAFT_1144643 [Neolentinus lepideus HHB14362 ss-1]
MSNGQALGAHTLSRISIFPSRSASQAPKITPLSILDAKAANVAAGAAFWVFDRSDQLSTDLLGSSLKETLNHYPYWAGELSFVKNVNPRDHACRFHRLQVKYGFPTDLGVNLIIAESAQPILSLVPDGSRSDVWDASQLPSATFIPDDPLPPAVKGSGVFVQITTFSDALVISVKIAHCLSDAHIIVQFMHNWVSIHRRAPLPFPPIFNPSLLDQAASGNTNAETPDASSTHGCPPFMVESTRIEGKMTRPLGMPMPWAEWDWAAPAQHYVVHFTREEVHNMWLDGTATQNQDGLSLSHLDTLLGFVWVLINRARDVAGTLQPVHLITMIGMRGRLLPDAFIRSPVILAGIARAGEGAALGALLHDMAYEDTLQRVWNGFVGRRHVIFTSWLRLGMYDVNFTGSKIRSENGVTSEIDTREGRPKYASSVMPRVDGILQITEARSGAGNERGRGQWWEGGVDVSLQLEPKVMESLVRDTILRKYRSCTTYGLQACSCDSSHCSGILDYDCNETATCQAALFDLIPRLRLFMLDFYSKPTTAASMSPTRRLCRYSGLRVT